MFRNGGFPPLPAGQIRRHGEAAIFGRMRDTSCETTHMQYTAYNKSGSEAPG